jgi:hypothetical protein
VSDRLNTNMLSFRQFLQERAWYQDLPQDSKEWFLSLGQIAHNGSIQSREFTFADNYHKSHYELFTPASPSQRFVVRRMPHEAQLVWDDTPTDDDKFSVQDYYANMGVAVAESFRNDAKELYLVETSLSRIWSEFGTTDIPAGIISAFTNHHSRQENLQRTRDLGQDVRGAGYGYVIAIGHYTDTKGVSIEETPLLIAGRDGDNGKLKGLLRQWREDYDQESVLFKPEGTTEGYLLSANGEDAVGTFHPNRVGEFMTTLRGGGTFVFEETGFAQMTFFQAWSRRRRQLVEKLARAHPG